jgi:hypothetical protein
MTTQAPERFFVEQDKDFHQFYADLNGMYSPMLTMPLDDYFQMAGVKSPFTSEERNLTRGYVGTWQIKNEKLYLTNVEGQTAEDRNVGLIDLFPSEVEFWSTDLGNPLLEQDRYPVVFANWFTGTLCLPTGRKIGDIWEGLWPVYERHHLIRVESGVVGDEAHQLNSTSDVGFPFSAYKLGDENAASPELLSRPDDPLRHRRHALAIREAAAAGVEINNSEKRILARLENGELNLPQAAYKLGDHIAHPNMKNWGIGTILDIGPDETLRVFFKNSGEKVISLDYVRPQIVPLGKATE